MRIVFYFLIFIITSIGQIAVQAADKADVPLNNTLGQLKRCGYGIVTSVETGDKLTLEDGTRVVLAGIRAPSYLYKDNKFDPERSWPYAVQSKNYLTKLSLGKSVTLHCQSNSKDRHGRTIAHVIYATKSINQDMVTKGWAFAYPYKGQQIMAAIYYSNEEHAQTTAQGVWQDTTYQPLAADRPKDIPIGKFVIIKGTVKTHGKARQDHYLNFGDEWKSDFTIKLSKTTTHHLETRLGYALRELQGKKIEVRGWTEYGGGPMIELVHADRLRLVPIAVHNGQ